MEIKKILVPVDGSDASKRAFKMAIDVAKVHGAKLVVTCIADVSEAAYPIMGVTLDKNGFINIKAKAERLLAALKEEMVKGPHAVLFKASNFMKLFKLADELVRTWNKQEEKEPKEN